MAHQETCDLCSKNDQLASEWPPGLKSIHADLAWHVFPSLLMELLATFVRMSWFDNLVLNNTLIEWLSPHVMSLVETFEGVQAEVVLRL